MIKILITTVAIVLAAIIGTPYLALELSQVAIVETIKPDGQGPRYTHIWYVQDEESLSLEAGHPDSSWVRDLEHTKTLKLVGEGIDGEYRFTQSQDVSDHDRIRRLMQGKYGWRDWWIAFLFDISQSRLIELEPLSPPSNVL